MKIVGSIQARYASSRFPGKVLKKICGRAMLLWQIERIKRSKLLDEVIVATTTNPLDDQIVSLCKQNGISYYRGNEQDVLDRVVSLIKHFSVDLHVEFFGDSPLCDAYLIDEGINFYLEHQDKYDYVSNCLQTTYPPGQEVIVYRAGALIEAERLTAHDNPLREHVNIHITQRPDKFRLYNLSAPPQYYYPEIYMEVDTPEDFRLISNIVNYFVNRGQKYFSLAEILDYLKQNKQLIKINQKVPRRWKEFRKDMKTSDETTI